MFFILVLLVKSEFVMKGCTNADSKICDNDSLAILLNSEEGKLVVDVMYSQCNVCADKEFCNSGLKETTNSLTRLSVVLLYFIKKFLVN